MSSAEGNEREPRKEIGASRANAEIRGGRQAFGLRHVRAPPQDVGRRGARAGRQRQGPGRARNRKGRRRLSDQRRDRVLQARAPQREVRAKRLGAAELRLGAVDVHGGGDLRVKPRLRQVERRAIDADCIRNELRLVVETAQVDIVARKLRMQFESRLGERVLARLGGSVGGPGDIAHPAPEVDLIGRLSSDEVVAEIGRLAR